MRFKLSFFFFFSLFSHFSVAQENFTSLSETYIELNKSTTTNYQYNFSIKGRQYLYSDETIQFKHRHLDFGNFSIFNLNNNKSIGLGLLYRTIADFEQTNNEFRITEQFNIKGEKINHRFRLDQRYISDFITHRFRYKLSFNIDLNSKNTYINIGNEVLHSMMLKTSPKLEYRVSTIFNHAISNRAKLQLGLEHRLFDINHKTSHSFVILPSAIFKI